MENLFTKLSTYHIINYLIPGVLFCYLLSAIYGIEIFLDNIFLDIFIVYIIGMILSRLGSLIIEKLLKKLKVIVFTAKSDYVAACRNDKLITELMETANLYRTLSITFLALLFVRPYLYLIEYCATVTFILSMISLAVLFLCSYIKQFRHISERTRKEN